MDAEPAKRNANCNKDFANPHFKPLWEPDRAVGRNAIKYSLVHYFYQQCIANADLCNFCTDEMTRRVSEAARRLKAKGLYHNDRGFMELFWQDEEDGSLVAAETIVAVTNGGVKVAVADHVADIAGVRSEEEPRWWIERATNFQLELKFMDRYEASPSRVPAWFFGINRNTGRNDVLPWQTRFAAVLWTYTRVNTTNFEYMRDFVKMQEQYLNYSHEDCQCSDISRLRSGVSFETVLMERVRSHISPKVLELIPFPPEDIWRSKNLFLTYFQEQSSGVRNQISPSLWDYAPSRGEEIVQGGMVARPLPPGWERRWVSGGHVWHHDCRGRLISRSVPHSQTGSLQPPHRSSGGEDEDLIDLQLM